MPDITLPIIGYVRSPLSQKFGIPRQPNLVDVPAVVEMLPPYDNPLAFEGLSAFSHLWVIWQFHQNKDCDSPTFRPQVRPPRLGGNQKIGVFATRSMYRPANLGLSVVQLDKVMVENQRTQLHIVGGDMVDGTPVIDIKPYIGYSDSLAHAVSGFAEKKPQAKTVTLSDQLEAVLQQYKADKQLTQQDIAIICQLLAQDPRPAYRQQESHTQFVMRYRQFDCVFFQDMPTNLVWSDIKPIK